MKLWHTRLKHAWLLGFLALAFVYWQQPQAIPPMMLTASKVWLGAVIGYWLDKGLYAYDHRDLPSEHDLYRRAIVVGASIIGLSLGI